jgi:hypothetical protein
MRSGAIHRWRSQFLGDTHEAEVLELRTDLSRVIPEVEELTPARREAVDLITSFEAWDRLRIDQALDPDRAREVVVEAILALLVEEP